MPSETEKVIARINRDIAAMLRPEVADVVDLLAEHDRLKAELTTAKQERDALAAALEIANQFLLVAESYRLGSTAWNSLPVDTELEMCRLRYELQSAIKNPATILAARDAEQRKAGAVEALKKAKELRSTESRWMPTDIILDRLAAQIERGETTI